MVSPWCCSPPLRTLSICRLPHRYPRAKTSKERAFRGALLALFWKRLRTQRSWGATRWESSSSIWPISTEGRFSGLMTRWTRLFPTLSCSKPRSQRVSQKFGMRSWSESQASPRSNHLRLICTREMCLQWGVIHATRLRKLDQTQSLALILSLVSVSEVHLLNRSMSYWYFLLLYKLSQFWK